MSLCVFFVFSPDCVKIMRNVLYLLWGCIAAYLFLGGPAALGQQRDYTDLPDYWKKRKPHEGYWQQDVVYDIQARVDEKKHLIEGHHTLAYRNNSPDTLRHVFFHLYQNAFVKDAYTRKLEKANNVRPKLGKYEEAGLGIVLANVRADGRPVGRMELDNTLLKIELSSPLLPGQSVTFTMDFTTYFDRGTTRRRMQMYDAWGYKHYNGCQWYPKICVYDAKFGWAIDQHLGKEFYGDFGTFRVDLDLPSNYIAEATGALQNREEVLPPSLRERLDIARFADKPWGEAPSEVVPYRPGERKVWKFVAEAVHDFAFTADPSYRIGTTYWNGIECVAIVQEPHASGWQDASGLVAKIIQTFSEKYGQYPYPKMVAADANDGMEYPMLTLDGGREPGYRGLLVHEIAHNWFYGMVGSNETYRAAMDEGFTQFLTADGLIDIDGPVLKEEPAGFWKRKFQEPRLTPDVRVMNTYVMDVANGNDHALNTHSDDFQGALGHGGGYRLVYYKTATMLYNLQYVLGDSLFLEAMRHYVQQWKFAHPYMEDFRNAIIQFTHVDLNWFFDQWWETTKSLDYGIGKIRKVKGTDSFDITLLRKGEMQMPLDIRVIDRLGRPTDYYVPNTWFQKQGPAEVLPRWTGWGRLSPEHTVRVHVPNGLRSVEIDPSQRLGDKDLLDNYRDRAALWSHRKWSLKWDGGVNAPFDRRRYRFVVRPDLWANSIDGLKPGIHLEGQFMERFYRFGATVWYATGYLNEWGDAGKLPPGSEVKGIERLNYKVDFSTPLLTRPLYLQLLLDSRILEGLSRHGAGIKASWNASQTLGIRWQAQYAYNDAYFLYKNEWSSDVKRLNIALYVDFEQKYAGLSYTGRLNATARAPWLSAFDYAYFQVEQVHEHKWGRLIWRNRLVGRYGKGKDLPLESLMWLSGASPEDMADNKFLRSRGWVPDSWASLTDRATGHFQYGGGMGLRGYNGYLVPGGTRGAAMGGKGGAAWNAEIDPTAYLPIRPSFTRSWLKARLYAFGDAGFLQTDADKATWTPLYIDAGWGAALTVKKWGPLDKAKPLTLRFEMPVYLNRPPGLEGHFNMGRWLIGLEQAF